MYKAQRNHDLSGPQMQFAIDDFCQKPGFYRSMLDLEPFRIGYTVPPNV
jgi:hypothetical protein